MRDQEIIGLQEAYASIYIQDDIVTEDAQQAVGKALDAAAKNPVIKAIGKVIAPVGKGRKTPTKTSDGYRAVKEDIDIFDVILEHLVAEGFADTNEAALVIMANMSEGWKQSIVEMGENIGKEPKTVGKPERPGVKGETYGERQNRMKPSSMVKPA